MIIDQPVWTRRSVIACLWQAYTGKLRLCGAQLRLLEHEVLHFYQLVLCGKKWNEKTAKCYQCVTPTSDWRCGCDDGCAGLPTLQCMCSVLCCSSALTELLGISSAHSCTPQLYINGSLTRSYSTVPDDNDTFLAYTNRLN